MKSRTFFSSILVLVLLLVVLAFPVMAMAQDAQAPAEPPPVPEVVILLIPVLTGSIGIPVINWLKLTLGWTAPEDKIKNVWLSFLVSVALAIVALLITGSFLPLSGPETLVMWVSLSFSVATLIYKSISVSATPPEPPALL
jgi:uncharacterized membrane protein YsdA (DUF1294 family)